MLQTVLLILFLSSACSFKVDFTSPRWARLQERLDSLPVFTCVNPAGDPLGYERDGKPISIFFADTDRAQQELDMATAKYPQLELRLIGVGLGETYRRCAEGNALLVPAATALAAAGDDWDDALPLFTCLVLSRPREGDGEAETPMFMDPAMAAAALDNARQQAMRNAGGSLPDEVELRLQVVCTSLEKAVEMVLTGKDKEACGDQFGFVPPRQSIEFLQAQKPAAGRAASAVRTAARTAAGSAGGSSSIFPQ